VEVRTKIRRPVTLDGVAVMPVGETAARWLSAADVVVSHAGDMEHRVGEYAQARGIPSVVMIHGERGSKRPAGDLIVTNAETNRDRRWKDTIVCHPHTRIEVHRTKPGERITLVNCTRPKGWDTLSALVDHLPDRGFLAVQGCYGQQEWRRSANLQTIGPANNMARAYRNRWVTQGSSSTVTTSTVGGVRSNVSTTTGSTWRHLVQRSGVHNSSPTGRHSTGSATRSKRGSHESRGSGTHRRL